MSQNSPDHQHEREELAARTPDSANSANPTDSTASVGTSDAASVAGIPHSGNASRAEHDPGHSPHHGSGQGTEQKGPASESAQSSPQDSGVAPAAVASPPPSQGWAEKIFQTASRLGPLLLLILLAAQVWPAFLGNDLYCPREAQSILIFNETVQSGQWLAPTAAGVAQWPAFAWLMGGLYAAAAGLNMPLGALLFPVAAVSGALLALLGVWGLSLAAGLNRQSALAAGMVLLCAPLFAPMAHFTGPESLSAALMLFSLACFCRGWQKTRAWLSLPLGFILAALAGLAGGPFYLLLPLLTSLIFLIWRGTFRRAQGLDGLTGFAFLLLILAGWLATVILWLQPGGYLQYLGGRLFIQPDFAGTWWLPLAVAGAGLLPWLAIALCVSWGRVLRTAWPDLKATRAERSGTAFLWIALVLGCLLSLAAAESAGAGFGLICLAAPLLAKALLRLSGLGNRLFFVIAALCLLHAGMALVAAGFGPSLDWLARFFSFSLTPEQRAAVLGLKALPILGGCCIAAALVLARLVKRGGHGGAGGSLLICALIAVMLVQPAALLLAPQLAAVPQAKLQRLQEILNPVAARDTAPATPQTPPAQQAPPVSPDTPPAAPQTPEMAPQPMENNLPAQPQDAPPAAQPDPQLETPHNDAPAEPVPLSSTL